MATSIDPLVWGAAGGVLIKLIDYLISRRSVAVDEASKLRSDLITELDKKNQRLDALDTKLEECRKEIEHLEDLMNERDVSYGRLEVQNLKLEAQLEAKQLEIQRLLKQVQDRAHEWGGSIDER